MVTIFLLRILFVLFSSLTTIYNVTGQDGKLPRYVVEDNFKNAIFGSYSYDPIRDLFVLPLSKLNYTPTTTASTTTEISSVIPTTDDILPPSGNQSITSKRRV